MADEKELQVKITADTTDLKRGTQEAATAFSGATNQIKTSINTMNTTVSTQMKQASDSFGNSIKSMLNFGSMFGGMIAGVLSVGALKGAIDATLKYNESVHDLGEIMGISAEKASTLNVALQMIGKTSEDYISVNFKLARQIKSNESDLVKLGIVTRDQNGNLLNQIEIFQNAISTMMTYKEGTDRNQFALYAFGRGAAEVIEYQRLNNELMERATEVAKTYGLEIGESAVEQTKRFTVELNVAGIILDSIKVKIGNALLPEIVKLSGELTRLIPVANAIIFVLKGVIIVVEEVALVFRSLYGFISAASGNIVSIMGASWTAIKMIMAGNISEAVDLVEKALYRAALRMKTANAVAEADAAVTHAFLAALWSETPAPDSGTIKGGKAFVEPPPEGKKETGLPELMLEDLAELKTLAKKADEEGLALLNEDLKMLKELAKKADEEGLALLNADLEILKENAKKADEEGLAFMNEDLQILKENAKNIDVAGMDLMNEDLKVMSENAKKVDKAFSDMRNRIHSIATSIFSPISSAFSMTIKGIIMGTQTLQQGLQNIFQSILFSFIDMGINMLMNWISTQMMQLLFSKATAAASGLGIITGHAAEAAAGAYAATAGIPIIGPGLAPAAATTAFGGAMSWAALLPAAKSGWDVDRDSLAMLHKSEMVLPSSLAEGFRGMFSGGSGSGGSNVRQNIKIMADDVNSFRGTKGRRVFAELKRYARNLGVK